VTRVLRATRPFVRGEGGGPPVTFVVTNGAEMHRNHRLAALATLLALVVGGAIACEEVADDPAGEEGDDGY
jgi:hypothetical protein